MNVGVYYPMPDDTCSFYRGAGPMNELRRVIPEVRVEQIANTGWSCIRKYDAIFVQRPTTKEHLAIIESARTCNIPTWLDFDDDFTCIPTDNPNWSTFSDPQVQKNLQDACRLANVITVTTESLKTTLGQFNQNVLVIPNAYDDYLLGECKPTERRAPTILWRGSNTHQNDLLKFKAEIVATAQKFPDFEWHFLGYYPFFLTDGMRHQFHKAMSINKYFALIRYLRPALLFCPLVDNQFNQAKSNIAWLEATYAGAVTVAPNFPQWRQPGVFNYTDAESFLTQMECAINSLNGEVNAYTQLSAEKVRKSFSLSVVNQLRGSVLHALRTLTSSLV
jgi:hypothetical protein